MRQTKTQGSALTPVLYLPDFIAIFIATFIAVLVPIAVFLAVIIVVFSRQITTYCGRLGGRI